MKSHTCSSWTRRALVAGFIALSLGGPPASGQQATPPAGSTTIGGLIFKDGVEVPRPSTERAPYDPTITGRTVAFYEDLVRKNPTGYLELRELAGAYLARQREGGDIADAVRAEEAARRSLAILSKNNAAAAIRLAQAMLAQHRFPEALAMARAAAQADSRAERIVIDVQLELGDYDAATRGLRGLTTEPDDLNLLALRARFDAINGKPDQALAQMRDAARIADTRPDMPAEVVGWYHTMVGHHLIDTGHLADGAAACEKALAIFPNDYRAMTGMAEAAAWRGDHADALKWATAALRLAPQNPEALRLAGEAAAGMGRTDDAARHFAALRALAHSFPRIYDQHWALFCLDSGQDLDEAMTLARDDIQLRHDVHAHDTLAWACYKKGLLDEADREMTLALARGTQEAGLFHHAAAIAQARGDEPRAAALLAQAKRLNPYLVKDAEAGKTAQP